MLFIIILGTFVPYWHLRTLAWHLTQQIRCSSRECSGLGTLKRCYLPWSPWWNDAKRLRRWRAWVQFASATLSGNSLRQTVHTHRASVHQAAKLLAALFRVAGVTAGLAESNDSLPPGLWLTSPAGWLPRTGISSGTLRSVIEYGLPLPFYMQPEVSRKRFGSELHAGSRPVTAIFSRSVLGIRRITAESRIRCEL